MDTSSHLSYPTISPNEETPLPAPSQPRQILKDRLYVGNLHPTVDEYTLLQIFSKFGKVTKLDFLFHKTGLLKGKPRGYAFVEYGNNDDAMKALGSAHDKLLRGRKLVVTFAHQAPLDQFGGSSGSGSSTHSGKHVYRKGMTESGRPTTLSMLKTGMGNKHEGTNDKIAMMEAKLRQMERSNPAHLQKPLESSSSSSNPQSSSSLHPSLPAKPPPPAITFNSNNNTPTTQSKPAYTQKPKTPLPSLPILPTPKNPTSSLHSSLHSVSSGPHHKTHTSLVGVKMGKAKTKEK